MQFSEKTVSQQWEQTAAKWIPHGRTGNPQQSWELNPETQAPRFSFRLPDPTASITHIHVNQIQDKHFKWENGLSQALQKANSGRFSVLQTTGIFPNLHWVKKLRNVTKVIIVTVWKKRVLWANVNTRWSSGTKIPSVQKANAEKQAGGFCFSCTKRMNVSRYNSLFDHSGRTWRRCCFSVPWKQTLPGALPLTCNATSNSRVWLPPHSRWQWVPYDHTTHNQICFSQLIKYSEPFSFCTRKTMHK